MRIVRSNCSCRKFLFLMTRAQFVGGYRDICEGRTLRQRVCCPTCEYLRYFKIDFLVIADRIITQDRQCTDNVTLRCSLTPTVAIQKQKVLHILSARL